MTTTRAREKRRDSYWRRKLRDAAVKPAFGDGCSYSPDTLVVTRKIDGVRITRAVSITGCCVDHDVAYYVGGDEGDRREADETFHACLRCRIGRLSASIYYYGVRLFGRPHFRRT